MRIGIMGGTFDPIHNGHLEIAEAVRRECRLDEVLLLPAGDPPHKQRTVDREDRLRMAQLAAQTRPGLSVSEIEVRREGTTYTVDTLRTLHQDQPETEWVYIIGADTVGVAHQWRSFEQVAKLCSFAVVGRPGTDAAALEGEIERLRRDYGAKIRRVDAQGPEISSTDVRERVARGESVAGLVPEGVDAYIRERGLYLCRYSWKELERILSERLHPGRFQHTLGVAETAMRLALRFGVDPQRARLAGLLHDCAKSMAYGEMLARVRGMDGVDEDERGMEPVLHAPVGAVEAQKEFGVQDPEILSAIRCHTLGKPDMTPLETLIFVADFIEPGRKFFDGLDRVRALAETDLTAAARLSAELSSKFVISRGGKMHARTQAMLKNQEV